MSNQHVEPGHGNSPAAWTAVVIMLAGIAFGTFAFFMASVNSEAWEPMVWVSVGIVALGLIVGFVMKKMGYGVGGSRVQPSKY